MQRRGRKRWADITVWVILFAFVFGGVVFFTPGGLQVFNFDSGPPEEPGIIVNGEEISATDQQRRWHNQKQAEQGTKSILGKMPAAVPSLTAAFRTQARHSRISKREKTAASTTNAAPATMPICRPEMANR